METMTKNERLIWAGAVVSARAHFSLTDDGEPCMRLVATLPDVLQVAARALGVDDPVEEREEGKGYVLELTGDRVHEVMTQLWPYLLNAKRRQYKNMRSRLHDWEEDQDGGGGETDES
jgi:hypothetical protein